MNSNSVLAPLLIVFELKVFSIDLCLLVDDEEGHLSLEIESELI